MSTWFFVSDLHGDQTRYRKLMEAVDAERPAAVLLGGDLLPPPLAHATDGSGRGFILSFLQEVFGETRKRLGGSYPTVLLILGNDDLRAEEGNLVPGETDGLWKYLHLRSTSVGEHTVYGYGFVPPTPFALKDWERYDVSRFVDPGATSPEEGWRSVPVSPGDVRYGTIREDLEILTGGADLSGALLLFHAPPYQSFLDRAALDGRLVDNVPLDVHVGSVAIRRFIQARQPRITLHGHVHESVRLTGEWRQRLGKTWAFTAAHDGTELALVRFNPDAPESATRDLL
jgi:Icc-related predicted phosphoesterase